MEKKCKEPKEMTENGTQAQMGPIIKIVENKKPMRNMGVQVQLEQELPTIMERNEEETGQDPNISKKLDEIIRRISILEEKQQLVATSRGAPEEMGQQDPPTWRP